MSLGSVDVALGRGDRRSLGSCKWRAMLLKRFATITTALLTVSAQLAPQRIFNASALTNNAHRMASSMSQEEVHKSNVFGQALERHGTDPITGYRRDGYCRPDAQDPAEHTLAGVLTQEFLEFSKARGNDLMTPRGGFPGLKPGCRWCLCVSRWKEAYLESFRNPAGSKIVPRVNLAGTSLTVLGDHPTRKVTMEELQKFKE